MPKEKTKNDTPGSTGRRKPLTTQEKRDLGVENQFLKGLVERDPDYIDAWQALGDNYTLLGRNRAGLRVDLRLAELLPEDPSAQFNLACSLAMNKKYDEAVERLHLALDLYYPNLHWFARDPELKELRKLPIYDSIRKRLKTLRLKVKAIQEQSPKDN
jgi:tetratricopeptide (TPR) repeat protein